MTRLDGNHFVHTQLQPQAYFAGAWVQTVPEDSEPRYPGVLAVAVSVYLISVPLLSAAERYAVPWVPQVIAVGVVLSWLVFGVVQGRRLVLSKPIMLYIAWLLWATSGFLVSSWPDWFLVRFITTAKVVLITWVCCQCVRTRADLLFCFLVTGSASLFIFYEGVDEILRAAAYQGESQAERAAKGVTLISDPNQLAIATTVLLFTNLICFLSYRSIFLKLLALAPVPCALYLLAASGSRTGMVGMLIAVLGIFWFHFRRAGAGDSSKRLVMVLIGLVFLAGAAIFVVKSPFFFRLSKTLSSTHEVSRQPRLVYTIRGIKATAKRPIFGLGLGGFASSGLSGWKTMHFSHSTLAETLSCTGVPGFLLYYGGQLALYMLLRKVRKATLPPRDQTIVNLLMAMFFLLQFINLVLVMFTDRLIWPLMGAVCGYLEHLRRRYVNAPAQPALVHPQ